MKKKFALVNYGGSYQLDIKSVEDLEALNFIDEAFWMATSVPTFSLNCSDDFIKVLDKNKSERVLSSDLRESVLLLLDVLKNYDRVNAKSNALALNDFSDSPKAQELKEAFKEILSNLGKAESDELTLEDLRNVNGILKNGLSNGDGIIPADHIEDPELQNFVKDIILCLGSADDVNGIQGIGKPRLETFLTAAKDYLAWKDSKDYNPEILPLHEKTADAYKVFSDIRPKINEYFRLCQQYKYAETLGQKYILATCGPEKNSSLEQAADYLKENSIAPLNSDCELRLDAEINPYYTSSLIDLREKILNEFLARPANTLIESDWKNVCDIFLPYEDWLATQKGKEVKSLDDEKLRTYLNSGFPGKLEELIAEDKELGHKLKIRVQLEEIIILQKEVIDFCNNFISFPHLYNPEKRAMFEAGHLVIDGRIFNFNIKIKDVDQHAKLAKRSGIYVMYIEITGAKEDGKYYICTPVTSHRLGLLGVDKRGVLFDLNGKEWDAKVVKVLDNPVSLTEATLAPFKKFCQMIIDAVDKISSGTEKHLEKQIGSTGQDLQKNLTTVPKGPPEPSKETSSATARDLMVTGSVTFAALGSSFAYITSTFTGMNWEHRLSAFGIGLMAIILPVMFVSAIKLYRRNISSILEASGWAMNAHMRLTNQLAKILAPKPDAPGKLFRKKRDILKSFSNKFKFRLKRKA